jgi:ribose transport system permease protein
VSTFSTEHRRLRVDPAPVVVAILFALLVVLGAFVSDRFLTFSNLRNVLEQSAALGFVALGQMLVVLAGGIDLSVGAIATLSAVALAGAVNGHAAIMVPMLIAALALGAGIGLLNGLTTLGSGVHPLIVTLGTGAVLTGAVLLYTLQPAGKVPAWFQDFAFGRIAGLPVAGLVMLAAFAAIALMLRATATGRALYAVGGNVEAARLTGIRVGLMSAIAYAASGFFAALAGAYYVSRTGVGDPHVGDALTLASITPVVVGGTVLGGGRGGAVGTLLGVLLVSLLNNLLNYMNISTFLQWVVQGLIIIIAVSVFVDRKGRL